MMHDLPESVDGLGWHQHGGSYPIPASGRPQYKKNMKKMREDKIN
jgi:hypothetical protein